MCANLLQFNYEHSTDCLYAQALAHYLNNDYLKAKAAADLILRNEGTHKSAEEVWLASTFAVEEAERVKYEKVGLGTAALGVGLALGAALLMKRR